MKHFSWLLAGVAVAGISGTAEAAPVDALNAMRDYNLIVFDDFQLNHDIQGSVYVDGDLSGGNMVGSNHSRYTGAPGLTVTGNVTGQNVKVKNSDVYVGGNVTGSIEVNDGGSAYIGGSAAPGAVKINGNQQGRTLETGSSTFAQRLDKADFRDLSGALARFAAETTYSTADITDRNNYRLTVADLDHNGIAVVNLEEGFLDSLASYGLYGDALSSLDTVVINVAGTHVSIDANWQSGTLSNLFASEHVIWNFFEAETVSLSTQIFGSVLAPNALLSNVTPIDGSVVAGSFAQGGQVHLPRYSGTGLTFNPPVEMPEPAVAGLVGLGFLGVAAVRRRKS
ncbi:collagen-binding domain-containing protein [Pedomonas mirosovicensis]|uniref:collagen-binding domain-containing protein n=1 Tax=Pedomonas mirosovicensis TaxID=2908641 RepID=UPI00216AADC2|nr:collagen-binding domain-containing protein [Pedomonas mirosovicensis]MCH8686285.1 choice-of-anchor A family protein [Pedomonas mirosovicensis]